MLPKEKIKSILRAILAIIFFAVGFIALRFGLALGFTLVQNIISDPVLNISFWVLQGIVVAGVAIYFMKTKRIVFGIAAIVGFIISFGFGPMD